MEFTIRDDVDFVSWGSGQSPADDPINTYFHDSRAQFVVLASELSGADGSVFSLSLYINELPGLENLQNFRIRMKHTSATTTTAWEGSWTDCFGPTTIANAELVTDEWNEFIFETPFAWDGTSNLMIDISREDTEYASGGGMMRRWVESDRMFSGRCDDCTLYDYTSGTTSGTSKNYIPAIKLYIERGLRFELEADLSGTPWLARVDAGHFEAATALHGDPWPGLVDAGRFALEADMHCTGTFRGWFREAGRFDLEADLSSQVLLKSFVEVSAPVIISLQAFTPARRWSIPSSRIAQVIYLCNLGDLDLSITSFQARMRDGRPTYLNVVVTAYDGLLEEIQARTDQQLVVRSGVRTAAGDEITEPLVTTDFDSVRYDLGGRSGSYTLIGYVTETTEVSKVERVTGVSSYGLQADGKRTLRCEPSFFLKPGDVARADGHADMIVRMISISVTPRAATMDLTER